MPIYDPIINDLIYVLGLLVKNQEKSPEKGLELLEEAVKTALKSGIPQLETYGIINARGFLNFANWLITEWVPTETTNGKDIYFILCIFYFVFDQPPLNALQTQIHPQAVGIPLTKLSDWIVRFAQDIGKHLSSPGSITPASLLTFQNSPTFHINECVVPEGGFKTFNEFFARKLKRGMRPVAEPYNPNIITFPADSTFDGAWPVNEGSEVNIKGLPWTIFSLLNGSKYSEDFKGGIWTHSFLNTFDYHRQHAPISGRVIEAKVIPGAAYLEVNVRKTPGTNLPTLKPGRRFKTPNERVKDIETMKGVVEAPEQGVIDDLEKGIEVGHSSFKAEADAPDNPGYQFLQMRGLVIIDSPELGKVAVLPIGMAQVSSVVLSVEEGQDLRKGDEISYFQFGGSDIVVVFQARAKVSGFPATDPPTHFNYGEQLATADPGSYKYPPQPISKVNP